MDMVIGYLVPRFNCEQVDFDIIKKDLDRLKIFSISIDETVDLVDKKILMCDENVPLTVPNNFFVKETLCVNKEYAEKNYNHVLDIVLYICKNTKNDTITIRDSILITDEIIEAIINNPNIKKVTLGNKDDVYLLTAEMYEKFKKTEVIEVKTYGVVEELEDNFDNLIGYNSRRNLIGYSDYNDLINNDSFHFSTPLTHEELKYFKYLNKSANVQFKNQNYDILFDSINILRECGHTGDIRISIEEKNDFNSYIFGHLDKIKYFDNVEVYLSGATHSLKDYMKYEKKLIDLIVDAINLSPFEKYLFAYNVVKKFKKYKENEDDKTSARDLYQIFDNEYMVCVGYSKLLGDLLDKLGIESYEESVSVDVGMDNIPNDEKPLPDFVYDEKTGELKEFLTDSAGHARRKIHLVDPKYGIEGYYFADPTWDNSLEKDFYSYALMTADEYVATDRYNYYSFYNLSELLSVHSLEEFYLKINIMIDKRKRINEKDVIQSFYSFFEKFDKEFYDILIAKYGNVLSYNFKLDKELTQSIFLDIGERILEKTNNVILGSTFKEAITVLYRDCYGIKNPEELENTVNKIMEYNKKRHAKCFPKRYKIDQNDNRMVLFNMYNKFDMEDEEPKLGI